MHGFTGAWCAGRPKEQNAPKTSASFVPFKLRHLSWRLTVAETHTGSLVFVSAMDPFWCASIFHLHTFIFSLVNICCLCRKLIFPTFQLKCFRIIFLTPHITPLRRYHKMACYVSTFLFDESKRTPYEVLAVIDKDLDKEKVLWHTSLLLQHFAFRLHQGHLTHKSFRVPLCYAWVSWLDSC